MTQEQIKSNFSNNLIRLRKAHNLTQLQLAEQLNYSDKAISKWEVGSVLPDIETMTIISEYFGITLNDLIYGEKKKFRKDFWKNRIFITLLSFGAVWFLASIIFLTLTQTTKIPHLWLTFIFAIPLSSLVLLIFSAIWFNKKMITISASALFWGIILSIFLAIGRPTLWFIFIIGAVGQLLIIFSGQLARLTKPKK
jgi:transcriptional regulator with XRE-family HTH domain